MMYSEPDVWNALAAKLAEVVRRFLRAQIAAGAQAVQLFDSWVGALCPEDYAKFVAPHVAHVLQDVMQAGVPVIHFGTNTQSLLELQQRAGGTVIGVDWRTPIEQARSRLGNGVALQGNLDPILLFAPRALLAERAKDLLNRAGKQSYVFNLGHGILPQTNPDQVRFLCDWVHEQSA